MWKSLLIALLKDAVEAIVAELAKKQAEPEEVRAEPRLRKPYGKQVRPGTE